MASRGLGYDNGTGASGAGGKIRRLPASRAAASPYARPAPAPAPAAATATAALLGGGWFSRLISAGASRLLPSLFRKTPPQLAAPPAPSEPLDATHSRPEASREPLLLRQDVGPASVQTEPEPLNAPPSPRPPPLEDDLREGEESGGAVANILATENSAKDREEDMLRNSDEHNVLDLEDLLKQRTFKRSEFEYLSELLWSRTVGSTSLKLDDGNMKKMHVSEKETGSMHSNLPVDFSVGIYSVSDLVASPAEIAKAYMGLKSANGSSLRLRLHDPSSRTIKPMEANTIQQARPPTIPLQGSRLHTSKNSDCFKSNFSTLNRSAICKMSSSPYFKSAASSDVFSNVSSSYQTPSSVHTFGRQVLKRKSTAVNNDKVSVGHRRKMHQRYNKTSPFLETRSGYHGHLVSYGIKLNEDSVPSAQTQKRRCLSKVSDVTLGGLDDKACSTGFGQPPVQSAEMAAKILKQIDTLVPSLKEVTPEIKQKHEDVLDIETHVSQKKEVSVQIPSEPSTSGVMENSLLNSINGNAKFTHAQVTEKSVDTTSNTSASLMTQSISLKDKPPTFSLRSHLPNLVLSSGGNKMPITSNGFTFPVPAVLGTDLQALPTPTMTSSPILSIEKLQPTRTSSASVTSMESGPRIPKSVLEEGSTPQKCDKKLNADGQLMSSKSSGQVTSFTCNPVFKFANSKLATLSNGLQHTSNSNGSINKASSPCAGSYTVSTNSASLSVQNVSIEDDSAIPGFGTGCLSTVTAAAAQSITTTSMVSSGARSGSAPLSSFPQFVAANSSATQDKTKAVSSSTPFNFSQQFCTTSSFAAQDKSKAASPGPTMFSGNHHVQPGNSNAMFTQDSACKLSFKPSEKPIGLISQSLANSPVISAPLGSPATGSTTGTDQMNGGDMVTERKEPPFSTISPFAILSNSPSTPIFSSPATQFAPTTTASPEIFKFGEQNASPGAFSIGSGGGNEKSGRKFIRVKRRK